jgi:hypothetical protein
VTPSNADEGRESKLGRRHFVIGLRRSLGRSRAFPGPTGSPQLPFAAALAARAWGMSIGALIKGEAALPSEVSLQCGRRSRMRWCNVWARPPGRRSREWRPTFRGGSCYRARRLPMTAMPESGVNPDAAGTTRSGQ